MKNHMTLQWMFRLALAALIPHAPLAAQLSADEEFDLQLEEGTKALKDSRLPMENPEPLDTGAKDGIRFYLTSLTPSGNLELYIRDGKGYLPIRAAYDTFGSLHRISRRSELELCEKTLRKTGDKEETIYQPRFRAVVPQGASPFVAVLQPPGKTTENKVQPLRVFDLSSIECPFDKVTLFNPFSYPLQVTFDQTRSVIPAYRSFRYDFKIRRHGAGYVHIRMARQAAENETRNLIETRIAMFKGSRGICLPYLDSEGTGNLGLLVHREEPPKPVLP